MQKGEEFYIKDLLYSLMLESHNDSAVVVAEGIAGSVEEFAKEMNAKAAEIGCKDTHFITQTDWMRKMKAAYILQQQKTWQRSCSTVL